MGREQRRKEAKKNGIKISDIKDNQNIDTGVEAMSSLKITIVVISLLVILYLILAIFVTKELDLSTDKDSESESTSTSVSNAILASSTFKQSDEEYYVIFYGFDDEDESSIGSSVSSSLSDYKVYKVDTGSGLNKNYVSDVGNSNVSSIDDLKVVSPTLIKISADKVTEYVEGKDNIESYLES